MLMSRKYPPVEPNKWYRVVKRGYKMMCCDCSLVHSIDFQDKDGKIYLRVNRDDRATAAARKKYKKFEIKLKNGNGEA